MEKLKQLRESARYTQKDLATMLNTTQQTIARWESGQAEPSLSGLRDLALIFETSVDELLGVHPFQQKLQTTRYHLLVDKEQDGFWGHIGITLEGGTRWFPVTESVAEHVQSSLEVLEQDTNWVCFSTLNNKYVAFCPTAAQKVWLLEDSCDPPKEDWNVEAPMDGLPLEMYRAFTLLNELPMSDQEWIDASAFLPKATNTGEFASADPAAWKKFCSSVAGTFGSELSERFIAAAAIYFCELELYEPDVYNRLISDTVLHFVNGEKTSFIASSSDIKNFIANVTDGPKTNMANFTTPNGADCFFPFSRMAAVEMPLIDLLDALTFND